MKNTLLALLLTSPLLAQLSPNGATASVKGSLPPKPAVDLAADDQTALQKRLTDLSKDFESVRKHERSADAAIFLKAVRYALAACLTHLGREEEAKAHLEALLGANPENGEAQQLYARFAA